MTPFSQESLFHLHDVACSLLPLGLLTGSVAFSLAPQGPAQRARTPAARPRAGGATERLSDGDPRERPRGREAASVCRSDAAHQLPVGHRPVRQEAVHLAPQRYGRQRVLEQASREQLHQLGDRRARRPWAERPGHCGGKEGGGRRSPTARRSPSRPGAAALTRLAPQRIRLCLSSLPPPLQPKGVRDQALSFPAHIPGCQAAGEEVCVETRGQGDSVFRRRAVTSGSREARPPGGRRMT